MPARRNCDQRRFVKRLSTTANLGPRLDKSIASLVARFRFYNAAIILAIAVLLVIVGALVRARFTAEKLALLVTSRKRERAQAERADEFPATHIFVVRRECHFGLAGAATQSNDGA